VSTSGSGATTSAGSIVHPAQYGALSFSLQKDLPAGWRICTPTLILWGAQDRINPPENGTALAQVQPHARLVLIQQAGHMPHQEQAQAVVDEICSDGRLVS